MARRGVALLAVVVVALVCGVVSAATAGPPIKPGGKPPRKAPPGTRFEKINPGRFGKRNYELACSDDQDSGNACTATCPSRCPNSCLVLCPYCDLTYCMCDFFPNTACGDPRFTGGDGNTFYFHGRKGQDFCILSDANLHINAHFIGKRNPENSRDFTWIQALGMSFDSHRLYIGARKAAEWDADEDHLEITFNGEAVDIDTVKNARWESKSVPKLSVTRTDIVNTVVVELNGVFKIMANAAPITDEDSRIHRYGKDASDTLVHLDLGFKFQSLTNDVHGVLGQTYRPDYVNKLDLKAKMPVMGGAPNYLSSGLFATDCKVSMFHRDVAGGVALAS